MDSWKIANGGGIRIGEGGHQVPSGNGAGFFQKLIEQRNCILAETVAALLLWGRVDPSCPGVIGDTHKPTCSCKSGLGAANQ